MILKFMLKRVCKCYFSSTWVFNAAPRCHDSLLTQSSWRRMASRKPGLGQNEPSLSHDNMPWYKGKKESCSNWNTLKPRKPGKFTMRRIVKLWICCSKQNTLKCIWRISVEHKINRCINLAKRVAMMMRW